MKKTEAQKRKDTPLFRGLLQYFPDALAEVSRISLVGSKQHHPDEDMHWDKGKSSDHADCILRHLSDYGKGIKYDTDGQPHLGKVAWRSLALLQIEIENANE